MLDWAVYREGALANWVRRDLEALLRPLRMHVNRKTAKGNRKRLKTRR
jgi:hypothetical protein